MPFKMYHTLYRSAWLESVAKAKEAEEAEKQAQEEERKAAKSGGSSNSRRQSAGEALNRIRSLNSGDLEDLAEEMGFDE